MNKTILLIALFSAAFGQQNVDLSFRKTLDRNSLALTIPKGFKETPIIANDDVAYDYALKDSMGAFEIRFRIFALNDPPPNTSPESMNGMYPAMLLAMAVNISNGKPGNSGPFDPAAVRSEFGADAGMTCAVDANSQFSKGFKYCLINVIHRNNVVDAYIFYLFNDKNQLRTTLLRDDVFHCLRFK